MNVHLRFAVVISLVAGANAASACSCLNEEFFVQKDAWAAEVLNAKLNIVHARVVEVLADGSARIEAIRWLKGDGDVSLLARDSSSPSCTIRFQIGEEFVYLLGRKASVQLCDRLIPKPAVLNSITQMLDAPAHVDARGQ